MPPTVCRRIDETAGSVQIWLEHAMPLDNFLEQSPEAPEVAGLRLQEHDVYVFDALIANIDRNQGNVLVDRRGTLWCIDHTRAFAQTKRVLQPEEITHCSRHLWLALRNLDEASLQPRLEPFLRKGELRTLFDRRRELVKHIEELIASRGEAAVLFDLDPR